jgi:plastocyanin
MRGWLVVVTAAALAGCYDQPKPSCSFSCQASQLCPEDYACAPDGLCHLVLDGGALAECPDLLPDASTLDAPIDAEFDANVDAGIDAPVADAAVDAAIDASPDAAIADAQVDASVDASPPDAAIDASPPDGAPDAAPVAVELISCSGVTPDAAIGVSGGNYTPVTTTIAAGEIVQFTPGGAHDMVSGAPGSPDGVFQTPLSAVACLRFNQGGTYPFYCSVHEFTGTVIVN